MSLLSRLSDTLRARSCYLSGPELPRFAVVAFYRFSVMSERTAQRAEVAAGVEHLLFS